MEIKMLKFAKDPCFGQSFNEIEQCEKCWIKTSCGVVYKNRK